MFRNAALGVLLLPVIAACAGPIATATTTPGAPSPAPDVAVLPPVQPVTRFRPARIMNAAGLTGIIGADAGALVRQFGTPRLDVWEDDARKLQFAGRACTLDVFLYPPSPNATERATYVEARRSDGKDVDRAACAKALRR
ncbi:hypothetical protein RM533_04470 [Croceicoccus sp. F390]|uniref:Uncharacterized protein n=1 Tax=Croceicoccus esteveae TaxID=3075597 RepID=A0ABU2ZH92_9SPHN|nr:hypothetical protein [Croceicoccus sp. F390]MDT0575433.1 hypothetical protein [Croceicoccus sp. F390]